MTIKDKISEDNFNATIGNTVLSAVFIDKTIGGFEIKDFKVLEKPIDRHILEPHIYEGTIVLPRKTGHNETIEDVYCTWDRFGKCSNWERGDCFIDVRNTMLSTVFSLGKKVYFTNEKLPYKVMALIERYAVVSRPLNRREDADLLHNQVKMGAYFTFTEAFEHNKKSPIYSIIDFEQNIKAPDNMVFGIYDYSKESDCKKVINDLESGELELSFRNRCELSVDMERSAK